MARWFVKKTLSTKVNQLIVALPVKLKRCACFCDGAAQPRPLDVSIMMRKVYFCLEEA